MTTTAIRYPTPAWATKTDQPDGPGEYGSHTGHVKVGAVEVELYQVIDPGSVEPVEASVEYSDVGAVDCRDLAAVLLQAAAIIEATA